MKLIAIDPGTYRSALVVVETNHPKGLGPWGFKLIETNTLDNHCLSQRLASKDALEGVQRLVVEQIKSYGNTLGDSILETVYWYGRFVQAWNQDFTLIPRKTILRLLGLESRSNDSNTRRHVLDRVGEWERSIGRFGGNNNALVVGTKDDPGTLYHVTKDEWQALALAFGYLEQEEQAGIDLKRALV